MTDANRRIYRDDYVPALLDRRSETPYDSAMIARRDELVRQHAPGRDLLDLCCGTGEYCLAIAPETRRTIGVDFSRTMLDALRGRPGSNDVGVVEADAAALPMDAARVDVVISFASLYHVPDVAGVLREIARVLRPGGVAVVELGNTWSLNTVVARSQHRHAGWAEPHHVSYPAMRRAFLDAGLVVESWSAFQLLPMFGATRRLAPLLPLLSARWKKVLGLQIRGRTLDELISTRRPLRYVAFRHLVVARKP